ncbi:MAG: DUF2332 domain-containing protein [Alphaproteobacteria bacterium]|nr:DUF2332 domain-containing protein [Alphaproteobacteria bacterium]
MPRGAASFRTEETPIAAAYRRFAETEAHGRSPLYEELASGVAADPTIIEFLLTLPREKRQPNLLLAAARSLCGTPSDWVEFRRNIITNAGALRQVMLTRSTQTNEPGRCAILLPLLARLPQPLALLEVGASAGLCLLPDRYGYDYDGHLLRPEAAWPEPPIFPCAPAATMPLPSILPQVAWRAGLDLNPIDVNDPAEAAWLETLVWPEQTARLARLRAAMAIAAMVRPRLTKGDLRHDLVALAAEMPREATRVIFHTAVLAYVSPQSAREAFARSVGGLCDVWIANEAPHVFPDVTARADAAPLSGRFLVSQNGTPVAWADPHGAAVDWIAEPSG